MQGPVRIDRRGFLRGAAGASLLSLLPACARTDKKEKVPQHPGYKDGKKEPLRTLPGYRPRVAGAWVPRDDAGAFYLSLKRTLEASTDFSWLSRGDRVFLKLALNSGNVYPATTDPWLLAYMVHILKQKGAGEIFVGDQSGVEAVHWTPEGRRGSSRDLCESTGLMRVIQDTGTTPCFFEERGYDGYTQTLPSGNHHWTRPLWVTRALEDVDHIIYLARVSSHVMGDVTSGMKLAVGFLRDDTRRLFHKGGRNFYAMYEEINQVPEIRSKLRLSVSSGRKVLANFGPDNGYVSTPERGLLLASEDLLAHEILSYAWLKWNRRYLTPAFARATTGQITRARSTINRTFIRLAWGSQKEKKTPDIPFWTAGNIYDHPSILNRMRWMGGKPEELQWERINPARDESVERYLLDQIHV
jgi:uncharacterized protein (DUF362 family)